MWERQEVQEVLPPVRIFPALPTKSAVRKLPYGPARSAVTQIHGPHDAFDDPCAPRCPMSRHRKDPLRPLTPDERIALTRLSRSPSAPAAQVERARALLAIADGASYTAAAHQVGRRHNETISAWVSRFHRDGLAAVQPRHGGGPRLCYGIDEQQRILAEMARAPQREQDGAATWSLSLLQRALRKAPDGLPKVSTFTIWRTLHEAGLSWQKSRTWCETGVVMRKCKHVGAVRVSDPDTAAKKS